MNLNEESRENVVFMIEEIKKKLQVVNGSVLNPDSVDMSRYEDLRDIYDMIKKKNNFSVSEMDAIAVELGRLRK
ncbi:DUF1128 domain-containing protein [Halalkalibacterium halodurans]|jgi:uncharacterized protein YfkK (UPF0435 family)|uniref:UPF0435 protein BH2488 n=2 Tax=Halalkalibacterium halodurans TaxID=86665 RepID=Y2488_HALH5|nr:DUF1128 domain-containing protein [Halalkalibacterium halodurans]Q9KA06.1 RecName: Full=UPF0435 protein BH2488 [Halalkalibacterium halodurans C-125]MDY7223034.1 DUF1128 domain-containing protein [Halalkalibacterium halodurans]MDY7242255.1 DUF1128 domain-containing protein [Halalkalibacterium halodurans]MED3646703.1 DUF1128 domain-containing protein [Halalkalibacterium halodurans]MED4081517.1 DUF1128 domain-containing protein [Halalkalibacterium halodurans]MED4086133.1 DUF1128 domain-contai